MKIKGTEVGTGRPLICVPVLEKTKEEVIKEVEYLVNTLEYFFTEVDK